MRKSITIAIDFGTTKTLISYTDAKGEPRLMRLGRHTDLIPTVAYMQQDGTLLFGDDAEDMAVLDPANYSRAFKMKLGSRSMILGQYTAQDLVREFLAYLLNKVREDATMYNVSIARAILTCPVEFDVVQLKQLQAAAQDAGLPEVQFVTEPEAAGAAYCFYCAAEAFRTNALVVDWGGGTLDVALITRKGHRLRSEKRHAFGDNTKGGEVFDDLLCQHIIGELADCLDFEKICWPELMKQVRALKVNLSSAEMGVLHMIVDKKQVLHRVQRKTFENLVADDVAAAVDEVKRFVEALPPECKPEMLVLVGGTALIPCVRRNLEAATRLPARTWAQAREAVVMGAALLGKIEETEEEKEENAPLPTDVNALHDLADKGNIKAQFALGQRYLQERHETYAFEWFTKAAVRHYAPAMERLAHCYEHGIGTVSDIQKALHYYQRAADDGNADALYRMGKGAETGNLQPVDTAAAVGYYRLAAKKGHVDAMAALGRCYADGVGGEVDFVQAYKYLRMAADAGVTDSQYRLAVYYDKGIGVLQDTAEAEKWYKKAAVNNHADALYALFKRSRRFFSPLNMCHRAAKGGSLHAKVYLRRYLAVLALIGVFAGVILSVYCLYYGHTLVLLGGMLLYAVCVLLLTHFLIVRPGCVKFGLGVLLFGVTAGGLGAFFVNAALPEMAESDWLVSACNGQFTLPHVESEITRRFAEARLTQEQMQRFVDKGYVIYDNLLSELVKKDNVAAVQALHGVSSYRPDMSSAENKNLLADAVKANNVLMVQALAAYNPDMTSAENKNLLADAIHANNEEMVQALCRIEGINANVSQKHQASLLYKAVELSNPGIVISLLAVDGIDVNNGKISDEYDEEMTPLYRELVKPNPDPEIVRAFVNAHGIDVNKGLTNDRGTLSPLGLAARKGLMEIVRILLQNDDLNLDEGVIHANGSVESPVQLAPVEFKGKLEEMLKEARNKK